MDLLQRMNSIIEYVEAHLTDERINYKDMANILYCSTYEFSRVFSFIANMSISEYIRKRRLSLAVFDIKNSDDKIIDIAIKYGYDSDSSFIRAFKTMHGVSPSKARKNGVQLKTYPKLHFQITVKGANAMNFRIEEKESFKIVGLRGIADDKPASPDTELNKLWDEFLDNPGEYNRRLLPYYTSPIWQVAAYKNGEFSDGVECIIGAELGDIPVPEGMDVVSIPRTTYAIFTFNGLTGNAVANAYTDIVTQWLPTSSYMRDISKFHLEVFPGGTIDDNYQWQIWLPIIKNSK